MTNRRSCFYNLLLCLICATLILVILYTVLQNGVVITQNSNSFAIKSFEAPIYSDRRDRVQNVCSMLFELERKPSIHSRNISLIIVDDENKLLYCNVPKVASSNWKRILLLFKNHSDFRDPLDIPFEDIYKPHVFRFLDSYTPLEKEQRIERYFKFLFVRHPFERVVSAHRSKFIQSNIVIHNRYGRMIIKKYRTNASEESLLRGNDVTLSEFVQYLIDPQTHKTILNRHWRPVFDLCHPCHIKYDLIGKLEYLEEDADVVLRQVKTNKVLTFPKKNRTITNFTDEFLKALITPKQVFKLYQMYEIDFKMFNYTYSNPDYYLPDIV